MKHWCLLFQPQFSLYKFTYIKEQKLSRSYGEFWYSSNFTKPGAFNPHITGSLTTYQPLNCFRHPWNSMQLTYFEIHITHEKLTSESCCPVIWLDKPVSILPMAAISVRQFVFVPGSSKFPNDEKRKSPDGDPCIVLQYRVLHVTERHFILAVLLPPMVGKLLSVILAKHTWTRDVVFGNKQTS